MFGQTHFFTQSRFSALAGVNTELGCGGGDKKCRKSKESPPWVCEKCAKKHPPEMGCGEDAGGPADDLRRRPGVWVEPDETKIDYDRTTRDVDDTLDDDSHRHEGPHEALGCDKCKEGQRKKRKKAQQEAEESARRNRSPALYQPYQMHGQAYRVTNLGHTHRVQMGQTAVDVPCPISGATSYDPTLNCMLDARGNAICSDGTRFPPGCPHTPPQQYFTPGVTPDFIDAQGMIEGQQPPPRAAGSAGASGTPAAPAAAAPAGAPVQVPSGTSPVTIAVAGAGAIGLGVVLFSLFK